MKRKYTEEQLRAAVAESLTVREVLRKIGANTINGGMASHIRRMLRKFSIDTAHFLGSRWAKGKKNPHLGNTRLTPDQLFVKRLNRVSGERLKIALLAIGVLHVCADCGVGSEWNGKALVLEIDHIDGDGTNNCRENLRFMCPNCHSQTPTFKGRNRRPIEKPVHEHKPPKPRQTKITWPGKEDLTRLVLTTPLQALGKILGVSDNAIRKRCISQGITVPTPGRGGWTKQGSTLA